ncbi:hypothetical protein ACFV8T_32155 [Streptomyces sp. NPDC059832]
MAMSVGLLRAYYQDPPKVWLPHTREPESPYAARDRPVRTPVTDPPVRGP